MADKKHKDIHPKAFTAYLGANPQVTRRDGSVHATGDVHDGGGLYLVIGKGAQRSWLYKFMIDGVADEMGLGSAHKVNLAAAREKHGEQAALVLKGINPKTARAEAKAKKALVADEPSFHELAAKAVTNKSICDIKDPEARAKWVASMAPHLMEDVTAKSPRHITRQDVITAIMARRAKGRLTVANKVLGRMAAVFEWCAAHGYMDPDAPNPAMFATRRELIQLPREKPAKAHHAMVPWRTAPAVAATLRVRQPRQAALATEWILLSAVRSDNGTSVRWTDIDLQTRVWTIPADRMKEEGHGAHRVPLTDRHLEILAELQPPAGVERSPLVFPDFKNEGPDEATVRYTLRQVYPHMIVREDGSKRMASIHGLRRTFRTWGANQVADAGGPKYPEMLLELCMAHVVGDAARNAYVQENNVELRRVVMDDWAKFLAEASNVIAFPVAA